MKKHTGQSGFTLLEILLVVAIIAILAGIVIVAINPSKQLGDARNAQRKSDVTTILNAMYQYAIDNNGSLPATPPSSTSCPGAATSTARICYTAGCGALDMVVALASTTSSNNYVTAIPRDPQISSLNSTSTDYFAVLNASTNRVTVCAPSQENGVTVSVTR